MFGLTRAMTPSRWPNSLRSLIVLGAVTVAAVGCAAIEPVPAPPRSSFDRTVIAKGAQLAAIGNCMLCHTVPGGKAFAGGRPIPTPFGTIFATNITPDPETGIGNWSESAFRRAMREGLDRSGRHLYPAFPYDHYTKVTDDDIDAIYAFVMTREPVSARAPPNALPFPLNVRPILAGWNALFLREGPLQPDPTRNAAWNRGAYLVEGLGHCGSCHTPRNGFGAEQRGQALAGGDAEGWYAPALNAQSEAPVPWTQDHLVTYLARGAEGSHGVAAGPMAPVAHDLSQVPTAELEAMATYLASQQGTPGAEQREQAAALLARAQEGEGSIRPAAPSGSVSESGAEVYRGACGTCHRDGWRKPSPDMVPLAFSTTLHTPDPRNLLHVILQGIHLPEGEAGPLMPGFAGALTNAQIATLVAYLRSNFTARPAWTGIEKAMTDITAGRDSS
jgi:mono/diheme cytochrome c family protein